MKKIKSYKDAEALVAKMLGDADIEILLWDEIDSNRIIAVDKDGDNELWCWLKEINTVCGTYDWIHVHVADVVELVYKYRKDVNKLNDLEGL